MNQWAERRKINPCPWVGEQRFRSISTTWLTKENAGDRSRTESNVGNYTVIVLKRLNKEAGCGCLSYKKKTNPTEAKGIIEQNRRL